MCQCANVGKVDLYVSESLLVEVSQCWPNRQNYVESTLALGVGPITWMLLAQCQFATLKIAI